MAIKILFLDDETARFDMLVKNLGNKAVCRHAKNGFEFLEALCDSKYDIIMLDHDLGLDEFTGVDAAKILASHPDNLNKSQLVIVHSMNVPGSYNMASHMKNSPHLRLCKMPGAWMKDFI